MRMYQSQLQVDGIILIFSFSLASDSTAGEVETVNALYHVHTPTKTTTKTNKQTKKKKTKKTRNTNKQTNCQTSPNQLDTCVKGTSLPHLWDWCEKRAYTHACILFFWVPFQLWREIDFWETEALTYKRNEQEHGK